MESILNRCSLQSLLILLVAGLMGACGNPEVFAPTKPLEVVHMPLAGIIDADWEKALPIIYFSDAVDPTSVNTGSVMLVSSGFDSTACGTDWQTVTIDPQVAEEESHVVMVFPGSASNPEQLHPDTCYQLTCTTEVKGVSLGPLEDLGMLDRLGIGAVFTFRTKAE
jgi:hypothetical protein